MKTKLPTIILTAAIATLHADPELPPIDPTIVNKDYKAPVGKAEVVKDDEKPKKEKKKSSKKGKKSAKKASSKKEPKPWPKDEKVSIHIISSGGTLGKVSEEAYGRTRYWRILKLYNNANPNDLKIGQEIKAPELPWLMDACGLSKKYPDVASGLLKVYQDYKALEDKHPKLGKEQKAELQELIKELTKVKTALQAKTEGVKYAPPATLRQLSTCRVSLSELADGTKTKVNHQSLAHERLSNTMVYAVLWARNGFK